MGTRRRWTAEQKLAVIKECEQSGVTVTLRKHGILQASYYRWKKKYELDGQAGLSSDYARKDPELLALQVENARLKKLVAEKELALMIKDEMIKKSLSNEMRNA